MAAYHHVLAPFKISIQDSPELENLFTVSVISDWINKT